MRLLLKTTALLAFLAEGPSLFAQNFEEAQTQATDVASGSLFLFNPAVPEARTDRAAVGAAVPRKADRSGYVLGAAMAKAGSDQSSYGLRAELTSFSSDEYTGADEDAESFSGRYLAAHYGMQIAGILRMGLLAQLYQVEGGTIQFTDGVASKTSGVLFGVAAGMFLGSDKGGLGVAIYPGMRGAAEAEGEHRILGRAAQVVVEAAVPISTKTTIGMSARTAKAPDGTDADVGTLDTTTGARPSGTLAAGWSMKHEDRWFHKFTWQREGYDVSGGADPNEELEEGRTSPWATRLKLLVGRESASSCQSYLGISSWLRDREVAEDKGASLPGGYSLAQITYLAMLSFSL